MLSEYEVSEAAHGVQVLSTFDILEKVTDRPNIFMKTIISKPFSQLTL